MIKKERDYLVLTNDYWFDHARRLSKELDFWIKQALLESSDPKKVLEKWDKFQLELEKQYGDNNN